MGDKSYAMQQKEQGKKIIITINGSYRPHVGFTGKCLKAKAKQLSKKINGVAFHMTIRDEMTACRACHECQDPCIIGDDLHQFIENIDVADVVLFGSPVYLDFPSPKLLALLSRLNCKAESTNRRFFKGKEAHILATGYCSGTKSVCHTIMGACEMLGFTIPGRSTYEYIQLWKDKKIRGGYKEDACFFKEK